MNYILAAVLALGQAGPPSPAQSLRELRRDQHYTPQAGQLAQPQNPNAPPPPPGTATLRGHVLAADTGLPLRKAQVRIMAGDIRENRLATTDADGKFEFKDVRAGRYTIQVSKGSYVGL